MIATVTTIGATLRRARATGMTMTFVRSDAAPETTGTPQTATIGTARIPAGPSAIAMVVSATGSRVTRSLGTSTCRAGGSVRSSTTAIVTMRCAALSHGPWRPSVPFEWSPVVTSAATMIEWPIPGPATSATCAKPA